MIVVNSSTRQFNIPGADLVFGVEADSGSEVKHFQCPRYVGNNLDLSGCFVRINFRNPNGEIDSYLVKDVTVDGDNVVFSWELTPKVTMYKGNVSFVMCVVGPDTKLKWHTTLGRGQVLEGLEPDSAIVEEGTVDVVAALIAMVEAQTEAVADTGAEWVRNVQAEGTDQIVAVQTAGAEAKTAAVAEIEAKSVNVRASIPEDYTSLENTVDGLVRGRAGAIVCEVAGSTVVVNDASNLPMQGMKIFGRSTQDGTPTPDAPVEIKSVVEPVVTVCGHNLCNLPNMEATEINGVTWEYRDGKIMANGTTTAMSNVGPNKCPLNLLPGTYTVSGGVDGVLVIVHRQRNGVKDYFTSKNGNTVTFDVIENDILYLYGQVSNGTGVSNVTVYPMVNVGETPLPWEPYKAFQTVELTHTLLGIPVTSGGNYTDSDGQQWICDEVDLERGVYVQRITSATLKSAYEYINASGKDGSGVFYCGVMGYDRSNNELGMLSDRFVFFGDVATNSSAIANLSHGEFAYISNTSAGARFYFAVNGITTKDEATAWLVDNTPTVYYPMTTPTETALSETEIAAYRALHSNYPNTTVLNDAGAHMVVKYAADTKLYIDNKIAALIGG